MSWSGSPPGRARDGVPTGGDGPGRPRAGSVRCAGPGWGSGETWTVCARWVTAAGGSGVPQFTEGSEQFGPTGRSWINLPPTRTIVRLKPRGAFRREATAFRVPPEPPRLVSPRPAGAPCFPPPAPSAPAPARRLPTRPDHSSRGSRPVRVRSAREATVLSAARTRAPVGPRWSGRLKRSGRYAGQRPCRDVRQWARPTVCALRNELAGTRLTARLERALVAPVFVILSRPILSRPLAPAAICGLRFRSFRSTSSFLQFP